MTTLVVSATDPLARTDEFCDWLREQGIEPAQTYQVKIINNKMKVYQYKIDDKGSKHVERRQGHPQHGEVATKEPFEVDIEGPIPGVITEEV